MNLASTQPTGPGLPGVSRLILRASKDFPRYSEADVISLTDGRLLLAVARKRGSDDFAVGEIIGLFSTDRGLTWDDRPHRITGSFGDVGDVMSVSLCRTPRGVHLFFLGRGPKAKSDTRVYQMVPGDEGKTWSTAERISAREGYHIVNNARVVRLSTGRMVVPAAYADDIGEHYEQQRVYCIYSDDDGRTWKASNDVALEKHALMEPGVAECADGSLYMTIRTKLGQLWEARSHDQGATWGELRATVLAAPAAPSTVFRDPASEALWLFWCNHVAGGWKGRSRQVVAVSRDNGRTWGQPRVIEDDPRHSYGYISVDVIANQVLLTYYHWEDKGQRPFEMTELRERLIPVEWFAGQVTPPVFQKSGEPVLRQDQPWEGKIVSCNSGLVREGERWRLWYTNGVLGPAGETLKVCYAESKDRGMTWTKPSWPDAPVANSNVVLPPKGDAATSCYHASAHRVGEEIAAYAWRRGEKGDDALSRYLSADGRAFRRDPERALISSQNASAAVKEQAGEERISNDAFDVVENADGTWEYFAARIVKATDPRMVIRHDNAAGWMRYIAHARSSDGVEWSPVEIVLSPDYALGDAYDTQFYGLQVLRYGGFYLGLLQTFYAESQIIQPEWAWSHNGENWARTRLPCIALGDEGAFDSRMIVFGDVVVDGDEIVWLYSGYDWRHNAFRQGEVESSIGRAVVKRKELDAWLATLPQP